MAIHFMAKRNITEKNYYDDHWAERKSVIMFVVKSAQNTHKTHRWNRSERKRLNESAGIRQVSIACIWSLITQMITQFEMMMIVVNVIFFLFLYGWHRKMLCPTHDKQLHMKKCVLSFSLSCFNSVWRRFFLLMHHRSTFFIFFDLVMWFLTLYQRGAFAYRIVNVACTALHGRMSPGLGPNSY